MKITIYTTTTCASCQMVKKYLDSKGKKYTTVNLDEHPERQKEAHLIAGVTTVPVTLVEYPEPRAQTVIVGWNPMKLAQAVS